MIMKSATMCYESRSQVLQVNTGKWLETGQVYANDHMSHDMQMSKYGRADILPRDVR